MTGEQNTGKFPFQSAQQLRMRAVFEKIERQGHVYHVKNTNLQKFEERLQRVQNKMQSHLERHTPVWIGRETVRLFQEHKGKLKPTLSPKGILQTETSPAAIARQAMLNVELRNSNRFEILKKIENRIRAKLKNTHNELKHKNNMKI